MRTRNYIWGSSTLPVYTDGMSVSKKSEKTLVVSSWNVWQDGYLNLYRKNKT